MGDIVVYEAPGHLAYRHCCKPEEVLRAGDPAARAVPTLRIRVRDECGGISLHLVNGYEFTPEKLNT